MKTAIITGGAQGIGRAITQRLLKDAFQVVIADSDIEAIDELANLFSELGALHPFYADVSQEAAVQNLMQKAAELGELHCLINNVGIANNKPLTDLSFKEWQRVIDVNLGSIFLCSKYAIPYLKPQRGCIINIASTRALMSEAHTEAYSASKGGVVALSHAMAISLGPEVRVNSISPGWIDVSDWQKASKRRQANLSERDHAQHPAGRVGRPEDIAATVAFLISDESGFISGQNIVVDGGMTRKMIYAP